MGLLGRVHRPEEQPRLAVMVGKAFRPDPQFLPVFVRREGLIPVFRVLARAARLARFG
ncbi:hypothetical protein D9M73_102690 [compost metagenome]